MIQHKLEEIELFLNQDAYENVIALLEKCIEENPEELTHYWYLGLTYLLQENEEEAQGIWLSVFLQGTIEEVEQWTLELTSFLEVQVQENISTQKLGNAKVIYEAIWLINSDYQNPQLLNSLIESLSEFASTLSYEKERESAIEVYLAILKLNPNHAVTWYSLALNYYYLEKYQDGKDAIEKAIYLDNSFVQNYHILGLIEEKMGNSALAVKAYHQVMKMDPHFAYFEYFDANNQVVIGYFDQFNSDQHSDLNIYLGLSQCYLQANKPYQAIKLLKIALSYFPENLTLKRFNQIIFPVLYESSNQIEYFRQRFEYLLKDLINSTDLGNQQQDEILKFLQLVTHFHLPYQGQNDLKIQMQYSHYIYGIMQKIYPQWFQESSNLIKIKGRKIRIGYVSSRLYTLGKLYLNWTKYCNKNKFEIYIYDLSGSKENRLLKYQIQFKKYSDKITFLPSNVNVNDLCGIISHDKLDIMILPEIGIDPIFDSLACLRLAPIQCTTWAHPVSSGSPCIDYFLSSDLMESKNGQDYYSEKLIRLPNLGFSFPPVTVPNLSKKRSDFNLKEGAIVYLCCQSLFKYLPQHDYLFPAIAQQNNSCQFVFLDPHYGQIVTQGFHQRLEAIFKQYELDYLDYCTFLPRSSQDEYLMLNQLSDIFLDALSWSGGLTTRHAIACGLPVVTCPGEMMRARHSYGILRMIGVTETIAKTEVEYIEIAVRLGLDEEWRQGIREKIMANKHLMFDDRECIVALEAFFEESVQKHSQKQYSDIN